MSWKDKYKSKRELYWPGVEAHFNRLPPRLHRQGRLLRNNLAVHFSDTGEFRDILLSVQDYPPQVFPFWFLDDFDVPDGNARQKFEKHLFGANIFLLAALYTRESILDQGSFFDCEYLHLADNLSRQADRSFSALLPSTSPFWEYPQELWGKYTEASLYASKEISERNVFITEEDLRNVKDRLAPYKLIPIAIGLLAGREADLAQLIAALDHFHAGLVILQDISTLENDLNRGLYTYPLLKLMAKMGTPLGKPYNPEGALGALLLTGELTRLFQDCREHLQSCRDQAHPLRLNTFISYLDDLEARVQGMEADYNPKKRAKVRLESIGLERGMGGSKPAFSVGLRHKAAEMAEGYLLSDPTFAESWEVHRHGLGGAAQVTARFPSGLILEVLGSHGHPIGDQVDWFLDHLQETDFNYYDHPDLPFKDSDNLGVLLRLHGYAKNPQAFRESLEVPLSWMRSSIHESGRIPVWIRTPPGENRSVYPSVRLLGEGCGSVEAGLLVGLLDYDKMGHQEVIRDSAAQLLDRFVQQGAGMTVNYPRLYCLWRVNQLISRLAEWQLSDELDPHIDGASQRFEKYFEEERDRYRISPQDAAFLILASLGSPAEDLFDPRWVTIVLKNQRSDGSWYGEPVFFVPNRGALTTWHSSHMLTTAFCYHALKTHASWRDEL